MDANAKIEIAKAIIAAHEAWEASYIKGTYRYGLSTFAAAQAAIPDKDIAYLVGILNGWSGEGVDWAERILGIKQKAA
jgi:hypothetical protein